MSDRIHYVTSAYGEKYAGMLLVCIHSLKVANPSAKVTVYWQDIPLSIIECMATSYKDVDWIETAYDFSGDIVQRISSKMVIWSRAIKEIKDGKICFLDSDTLILKDVSPFFKNKFDVAFTAKNEIFPLNTGVMLVRKSEMVEAFFEEWKSKTIGILKNDKLKAQANSLKYPYGGPDQMSFHQLIRYDRRITEFKVQVRGKGMALFCVAIPCAILNETNSVSNIDGKYILHYKGGWRPILTEGRGFSKNRSKKDSLPMYIMYLQMLKAALVRCQGKIDLTDCNIVIPSYLDFDTLKENRFQYCRFHFVEEVGRVKRWAIRKFNFGIGRE